MVSNSLETKRTSSFANNFFWQKRFIPEIKSIMAKHIITESEHYVDCQEATDLVVLRNKISSIACRVRKYGFADRYPNEFTIRKGLASGAKTELEKINSGFCDLYFYGHASKNGMNIESYVVLDMDVFRETLIAADDERKKFLFRNQSKTPTGEEFIAFNVNDFSPRFLLDRRNNRKSYPPF